jgi:hypothetical protein
MQMQKLNISTQQVEKCQDNFLPKVLACVSGVSLLPDTDADAKMQTLACQNNHTTNMKKLKETGRNHNTKVTTHGLRCLASPSKQRE